MIATRGLITRSILAGIADAIRSKTSEAGTIKPSEMAVKIESISGGGFDLNPSCIIVMSPDTIIKTTAQSEIYADGFCIESISSVEQKYTEATACSQLCAGDFYIDSISSGEE